jgi:hypothetical protein
MTGRSPMEARGATMSSPSEIRGGSVARAKQTGRAEARRRYRQTSAEETPDESDALDYGERRPPNAAKGGAQASRAGAQQPTGRVGIFNAFRLAYHPARIREDIAALPTLVRNRGFLLALLLVVAGSAVAYVFWNYTGGRLAWELLILPGSALAPQLIAGFFAPRASYLLGFLVGLAQGIAAPIFLSILSSQLETPVPADQMQALLLQSFVYGPVTGALFAAAAAWYRRFLALSSPNRGGGAAGRAGARRPSAR